MLNSVLLGKGRMAEVYEWGEESVIKLFYEWCSQSWVEHEYNVSRIVSQSETRSPRVYELIEVEDRKGIVYERVDGPTMLKVISSKPWQIFKMARTLAELHAETHKCEVYGLPNQIESLENRIRSVEVLPGEVKEKVITYLNSMTHGNQLCHGDFHPDNVIMSNTGAYVIDWSNATLGHAAADVARTSLMITSSYMPPGTKLKFMVKLISLLLAKFFKYWNEKSCFNR